MTGNAFRTWLQDEIDAQGLSRREVARRMATKHPKGVTPSTAETYRRAIYKYLDPEQPSNPTQPTREAIAEALGVDPSTIPADDDDEEADLQATLQALLHEQAELSRRLSRALKEANAA